MSTKNNKTLVIAIVIFLALAIFGAAVFGGFLTGDKAVDPTATEQLTETTDLPTDETAENERRVQDALENGSVDLVTTPFVLDLNQAMAPRGIGNPNAPVKIVEYASLTCSHCADFNMNYLPDVKTKLIDTGKVYLEFREFPLNAPALDASLLARCLPADRYESFTSLLFKTQEDWTTRPDYITVLKQNAKLAGLSEEGADTCLKSQELRQAIGAQIQAATDQWKISSTPTFVINDGKEFIRGAMPVDEFERVIAKIEGAPAAEAAPAAPEEAAPAETAAPEATAPAATDAPAADETTAPAADDIVTPEETPAAE